MYSLDEHREELSRKPLTKWICQLLREENKFLSTTELYNKIRMKFPVQKEFPKGLGKRVIYHYLNDLELVGVLKRKTTTKNVAFWKLEKDIWMPVGELLKRIDKQRIERMPAPDWAPTYNGVTIYEFPEFHLEWYGKDLIDEFSSIIEELKNLRKRFWNLNIEAVWRWKKKIISENLLVKEVKELDKYLGLLYCFCKLYDSVHLKRWFGEVHLETEVNADNELVKILHEIFYKDKSKAELHSMLTNYKIGEKASHALSAFNGIDEIYPLSYPSTILIRIPDPKFDMWMYQFIKGYYKREEKNFKLSFSEEIKELENMMNDYLEGFYELKYENSKEKEEKGKEVELSKIKSFIKEFASELLS